MEAQIALNPIAASSWRVTASNPVRVTDGIDFERCAALHNELVNLGWIGSGKQPGHDILERPNWFDFYGDTAEAVRNRLSPSLASFLEQAVTTGDEHSLFYYVNGLSYPGSMWQTHEAEDDDPYRYLTLYTANNIAFHPEGLVFDQKKNKAIVQMSIWDSDITHNGRQEWYPLEVILTAWLDMVDSGKAQAVTEEIDHLDKYDPWIIHPYSNKQVEETVEAFNDLVKAIESRLPAVSEASAPLDQLLLDQTMDETGLPYGFARSFLTQARRPRFRNIAPGLEIPDPDSFSNQPFQPIINRKPLSDDGTGIEISPILLFRSTLDFVAPPSGSHLPFGPPYDGVLTFPSGLYLTDTERGSGIQFEDETKLILPFAIGSHGFAQTADGACFGENKEADTVEAKDTYADLYQLGYIPFIEQHGVRLAQVLRAWLRQVESGQWSVGAEGVEGGMEKWREADTNEAWEGYTVPVSW